MRIKVMQALYAKQANADEDLRIGEKNLSKSIQQCETLSYYFYSIFPEIKRYLENKFDERKTKNYPTPEDLNPNTKFIDNQVIRQMEESEQLNSMWNKLKVDWSTHPDLIIKLYTQISEMDEFQAYMSSKENSYKADKAIILLIVEKIFGESQLLHWYFEERFVHWSDDYNDALLQVYQSITFWKASNPQVTASPLFKNEEEDVEFYKNLYKKTISHDQEYEDMITSNLQNWETERIIETDMILMKMAVCELMEFPSIPTKVTINEYIEIAKVYGSEKSGIFINGMVDKIARQLREEGLLHKTGRGLINQSLNLN